MSLIWPGSFISNSLWSQICFGIRVEKSNLWNSFPLSFNPQWFYLHRTNTLNFFDVSRGFLYLMMVMLPGVVYRFTLSVSIWLFLPSVMYEVVTRGLTEPIDFCQQSRNCKNLIKVVERNFDYSCWRNNPYIIQKRDPTLPNSGFQWRKKKLLASMHERFRHFF